ncbi:peroxidase family protein [Arthrobacter sp. GCM10027362]|uniref:peroxidase family protein n=1 Tax=Arthrobacter sp. GCM10027362 TaxID=3273379 RepID=UPI00363C18FB
MKSPKHGSPAPARPEAADNPPARAGLPEPAGSRHHTTPAWRLFNALALAVDRRFGWYRLPKPLGLLTLVGVRNILRQRNLFDTTSQPQQNPPAPRPYAPSVLTERTADGSWNDLDQPAMGMAGTRFGRNVPIDSTRPEPPELLLQPNPREVSRRLMTRDGLIPATAGNALIAAWLQFMIRDWFSHGSGPGDNPWVLPIEPGDDWPAPPLLVPRTPPDPTVPAGSSPPPTYINVLSHWWDGSQIYGGSLAEQDFLRSKHGGKLRLENGLQPFPTDPAANPVLKPGFWLGTAMMQTLFALEHNAVCERLAAAYPAWNDEQLFQRGRLITAALLAKIHTVEWTPAVVAHPTSVTALHANWYGLAGRRLHDVFGRISPNEIVSGIPGSQTQHYGVPYALTEEFVAVYRMHPLIPDSFDFRTAAGDTATLGPRTFKQLTGPAAADLLRDHKLADLLYTFGTMNPGLVTLHNYPKHLQTFRRPDGRLMDLAATDILRSRELGVPRYTAFRRLLHLPVPRTFAELTDNPDWARELSDVYRGDIDRVDLLTGMFAEPRPRGFAFSDTAFRIFILMASRRLNSDRFFTRDFTPAVYTTEGMHWIHENTMGTVLLRHCPELAPALRSADNAFALWPRSGPR